MLRRLFLLAALGSALFAEDESPLELAVQSQQIPVVKALLAKGAAVDGAGGKGMPLWHAVFRNNTEMVNLLLANGARVKEVPGRVDMLDIAIRAQNHKIVKSLTGHGARISYYGFLGACSDSDKAMVEFLLSRDGSLQQYLTRCLDFALEKEKYPTVRWLLTDQKTSTSEDTLFIAMQLALEGKNRIETDLLATVIDKAEKIDALDQVRFHYKPKEPYGFSFQRKTAVMIAAYFNRADMLKMLLAKPQDLNLVSEQKSNALHFAVMKCSSAAVTELVKQKINVNQSDIFEKTPMNYAVEHCPTEIAKTLSAAGGEARLLTRGTKKTIRDIAIYYGIPLFYAGLAIGLREGVYASTPDKNWFGQFNGILMSTFLLGPLPAFLLVETKTLGMLGAVIAPYIAVIGGAVGLVLGIIYRERFNDNAYIYYGSVLPIFSITIAKFYF